MFGVSNNFALYNCFPSNLNPLYAEFFEEIPIPPLWSLCFYGTSNLALFKSHKLIL